MIHRCRIQLALALGAVIVAGVMACNRRSGAGEPANSSAAAPPLQSGTRMVTLERMPCFGSCPVYTVVLESVGRVRFEGTRNVSRMGEHSWRVSADSIAMVFRFADSVRFASLPSRYDYGEPGCTPYIADLPGFAITLEVSGTARRVYADLGCPNVPVALKALPALIDRVAGVSETGRP